MKPRYYRRDGSPYPNGDQGLFEWARDLGNPILHRVALDRLPNGVEISTVWLGLDHNYSPYGRPLIFETMLFFRDRDSIGEQWRYSTEEEAIRGHKMLLKKWSKMKSVEQVLNEK